MNNVPENDQNWIEIVVWPLFTHNYILVNKKVAAVQNYILFNKKVAAVQRFMVNLQVSHERKQVINQYLYLHFPTHSM